jgi:hypothetical protein
MTLPEDAGIGEAPHSIENAASLASRPGLSPAAIRSAVATWGPTPPRASSRGRAARAGARSRAAPQARPVPAADHLDRQASSCRRAGGDHPDAGLRAVIASSSAGWAGYRSRHGVVVHRGAQRPVLGGPLDGRPWRGAGRGGLDQWGGGLGLARARVPLGRGLGGRLRGGVALGALPWAAGRPGRLGCHSRSVKGLLVHRAAGVVARVRGCRVGLARWLGLGRLSCPSPTRTRSRRSPSSRPGSEDRGSMTTSRHPSRVRRWTSRPPSLLGRPCPSQ